MKTGTMYYSEPSTQAWQCARSALRIMEDQRIPPNPMNFCVWYGYFTGRFPDLRRDLDTLLSNKEVFTEARNDEVYERFFGAEREAEEIRETGSRIHSAVSRILDYLEEAGRDTGARRDKLVDFSGRLSREPGGDGFEAVVGQILSETQQIVQRNLDLERRLGESSEEITALQQHLEEVRAEALTDGLTGIANRKCFDVRLREDAKEAMESGEALSLLLTDIDHFKKFNDSYGHRIGDEVLKVVSRTLKEGVKGRDTPARFGGEEFCVILPQTRLENAVIVAEQIRTELASKALKHRKSGRTYGTITISVGVAQFRLGEPLSELVQRADAALYRAKRDGRNRVVAETALDADVCLTG